MNPKKSSIKPEKRTTKRLRQSEKPVSKTPSISGSATSATLRD